MKILLIQTAFPGDVILATSLVADLSERYPSAILDVLVRKGCEDILVDNPRITRIWVWDKTKHRRTNMFVLARELQQDGFDRVYNLQRYASSGYFTWRSGAPFTAGFRQNPFSLTFKQRIEHRIPYPYEAGFLHEVQRNRLLIDAKVAPPRRPELYFTAKEWQRADEIGGGEPFIVVAPASNWFTKQWPEESWAGLLLLIPERISVMIVGGTEDFELGERLAKTRAHVVNLCGKLRFRETAALMQCAWRVFTNDSAPLHLASAVNAPVTAVFCSTKPEFGFGPLSDDSRVVQATIPCCSEGLHGARTCKAGHFNCARSISPSDVLGSAAESWNQALNLRYGAVIPVQTEADQADAALITQRDAVSALLSRQLQRSPDSICLLFADLPMVQRYFPDLPKEVIRVLESSLEMPVNVLLTGIKPASFAIPELDLLWSKPAKRRAGKAVKDRQEPGEVAIRIPADVSLRTLVSYAGGPLLVAASGSVTEGHSSESGDLIRPTALLRWTSEGFTLLREGPQMEKLRPLITRPGS